MASPLAPSARPATAASPIAVEIRAVSRRFDQVVAVDDVSLAIRSGEFFSLLGPSGCGKTTLLRLIGGFEHADSGRILLLGEDVTALPPHLRRANTIFQHLALFPHMNVFDNIAFGLRMKHLDATAIARKVNAALSLVSLEGYGRRRIDQLSGGQKQRIAIARALVNEPAVLLLDEPLGALDLKLRLQMQDELRRIQRSLGSPFIFVTHDQGEAMAMSDRIAVMQNGRILQTGTPAEIYERPRSLFVAQFVGHANLLRGRIAEARGAGRYCVEAEGLRIPCLSSQTLAPGTAVTLSLRHEKVAILDSDAVDDQIVFGGVITVKTYLGATLRFEVRLDTGAALTAELPNTPRSTAIAVGDGARIGWSVESPHLLTE